MREVVCFRKSGHICICVHCNCHVIIYSPVSISSVMVTQGPVRTLYTEDDLTLTCTIELDEAVDTGVDVTVVWTGPPGDTMLSPDGRITVSEVTGSRPTYQSIVDITSLQMSDSGNYTCNATASPDGIPFVTASQAGAATTTVQFVGKVHLVTAIIYCRFLFLDELCVSPHR